jgi:hypothetical protein
MVLIGRARWLGSIAAIVSSAWTASAAEAQSTGSQASALHPPPAEYQPVGIRAGNLILYPDIFVGLEHDNNIYAEPADRKSDEILHLIPELRAQLDHDSWKFRLLGEAYLRRYARHQSENSTAAIAEAEATFSPRDNESVHALAGWRRLVEDRGDPEANPGIGHGPRISNLFESQLAYRRERGAWLIDADASASKFDYLAAEDVFRDHLSVAAQLAAGHRIGGLTFATVTGFVEHRSFDRKIDLSGLDRDATTYGARAGFQITPGGLFEGGASLGLFHFDPADKQIDSYNGLSASANVTYRPTERTALLLDAFRGNVATYRTGAQSRTDTRFGLTVQQELHHDVTGHITGYMRDTKFRGSGVHETTYVLEAGAEYLISRHLTVGAVGKYSNRSSDDPFEEFSRTRLMAYVRARL